MSRSKQPAGYPAVYYDLIEMVMHKHEPFTLKCESNKNAQMIRFKLYDFIKACRKSLNKRERDIGELAYGLVFSIDGDKLTINIRDMLLDATELQAALDKYMADNTTPGVISKASATVPITPPTDAQEDLINRYLSGAKKK